MDLSTLVQMKDRNFLSPTQAPLLMFLSSPPPPPFVQQSSQSSNGFTNLNNKVSPSILLIIIILAIIFFISGVLHLLVRFLLRPQNRDPDEMDNVTALQGQLQQLFHLHDAGVDQSFIDALPVFNYKAIIGVKDPFDCAVCLCEFEAEDKLRLLPKCSHAFHMECIDTWLLSHSTCPLCRASLLSDFAPSTHRSPIVLVLESGGESSREIGTPSDAGVMMSSSIGRVNSQLTGDRDESRRIDLGLGIGLGQKSCEIQVKEEEPGLQKGVVVAVKLGKFKNVDGAGEGGSSDTNSEARRCFSMGSFAYVMDETSSLQVPIRTPLKKPSTKKPSLPLTPGHRPAMSECGGCGSSREFNGLEAFKILELQSSHNDDNLHSSIGRPTKKESISVSKIWLRGKKEKQSTNAESSRRAFSFRFPINRNDMSNWGNGFDEEVGSCNSLDSQPNAPSFARRTLLWLMGKPNKVVHSSSSTSSLQPQPLFN